MNIVPFTPISKLYICQNVPLNNNYTDVLDFSSASAQLSYFTGKAKYTFSELTPIRFQNTIRVPRNANDIADCNYIVFQNSNFSNKWFYGFITSISYENPNMCNVGFEIDVMQTWQFDMNIGECLVEREHVNDDTPFKWLAPEPFTNILQWCPAEKTLNLTNGASTGDFISPHIVVAFTVDQQEVAYAAMYSGIYSGIGFRSFPVANYQDASMFILELQTRTGGNPIVAVFMSPVEITTSPKSGTFSGQNILQQSSGSYTYKNNKLCQYPFTFFRCTSTDGESVDLQPELFDYDSGALRFSITASTNMTPVLELMPRGYRNNSTLSYDLQSAIHFKTTPQCAYQSDVFAQWQTANEISMGVNNMMSAMSAGMGAATGNPAAVLGGISGIFNNEVTRYQMSIAPNKAYGTGAQPGLTYGLNRIGFIIYCYQPTPEQAQLIDQFFEVYGYAVQTLKVPNTKGRPYWNYVKTNGSKVTGNIGFDDLAKINSIFNNGVTFWHDGNVGNYDRNNH